jgi:hypothetical protein
VTLAAVLTVSGLSLASCGKSSPKPTAQGTPSATHTTKADPVSDCATKVDYWISNYFLKGIPDHGDYQELGLSSSEGLALRTLENNLSTKKQTTAATAPTDLRQQERQQCINAGAATPVDPNNPIGWP